MSTFQHTDATFTTGPPALGLAEPALVLQTTAFHTLGISIRQRNSAHPHRLCALFIRLRVESGIRRHTLRDSPEDGLVFLHRGKQ
jgi:hypothetical protein